MPKFILILIGFLTVLSLIPMVMPHKKEASIDKQNQAVQDKDASTVHHMDKATSKNIQKQKEITAPLQISSTINSNPVTLENLKDLSFESVVLSSVNDIILDLSNNKPPPKTDFQTDAEYSLVRLKAYEEANLYGDNIYYFVQNKISSPNFNSGLVYYDPEQQEFKSNLERSINVEYMQFHRDKKEDYYLDVDNLKSPTEIIFGASRKYAEEISGYLSVVYMIKPKRPYYVPDERHKHLKKGFHLKSDLYKVLFVETNHIYDEASGKALPNYTILKSLDIEEINQK